MDALRAVVYVSTATPQMTEPQLEALLVEARKLNLESGVTGVLLYYDGCFIQYFEGEQEAMRVTYERIRASRRHGNLIELLDERIEQRSFADWQMGFAQPTRSELLALSTARWRGMAGSASAGSPGLALLQDFWRRARP